MEDPKFKIKRGTTPMLELTINGLDDSKEIKSIRFMIKQKAKREAPVLVEKVYEGKGTDTVVESEGLYYMQLTERETHLIKALDTFYLDTQIRYSDDTIPETNMIPIYGNETLFTYKEVEQDD